MMQTAGGNRFMSDVLITENGAEYFTEPQTEIVLLKG
jgi:hypothetical protein